MQWSVAQFAEKTHLAATSPPYYIWITYFEKDAEPESLQEADIVCKGYSSGSREKLFFLPDR